jgi:cytochrome c oxidase assembly protein subunit 15
MHLNNVGSLWLRRYAVFVAFCTFGLLIAGGLVTSNDAALSVPDWPLSWGHLVPTLQGGIRYEFAHRAAAMLVALLTVALAIKVGPAPASVVQQAPASVVQQAPAAVVGQASAAVVGQASACQSERSSDSAPSALSAPSARPPGDRQIPRLPASFFSRSLSSASPRLRVKQTPSPTGSGFDGDTLRSSIASSPASKLAWAAVAVVLAQSALGGVTVRFLAPAWATIAHASLGQLFFALIVAICVGLYTGVAGAHGPSLICAAALFAQTILGAGVRYGVVAPVAHIVGAVLATILVMWAGLSILMRNMDSPKLRRPAMLLLSITFSQVFLGIGALMARVAYAANPQPMPLVVLFTVAHVAVGALALGAAIALAMLARPDAFPLHGGIFTA